MSTASGSATCTSWAATSVRRSVTSAMAVRRAVAVTTRRLSSSTRRSMGPGSEPAWGPKVDPV